MSVPHFVFYSRVMYFGVGGGGGGGGGKEVPHC